MINKAIRGVLLFVHFVLTRGAALIILGSWVWYLSSSFNVVSNALETAVQNILTMLGTNQFFTLLIMQSKPEQVLLFMLILMPLYILFSFVLYPLRRNWLGRTLKMAIISLISVVTLYVLAWFSGDFFGQIMDAALVMREYIFTIMGTSETAERLKAFVHLIHPQTILAVILVTIFFYLLFALPALMRYFLGAEEQGLTGESERALFQK